MSTTVYMSASSSRTVGMRNSLSKRDEGRKTYVWGVVQSSWFK